MSLFLNEDGEESVAGDEASASDMVEEVEEVAHSIHIFSDSLIADMVLDRSGVHEDSVGFGSGCTKVLDGLCFDAHAHLLKVEGTG